MSGVFRTLAASTKTLAQAMSMAGVIVLAIVIYTGFVITAPEMAKIPWFSWIRWINPIFYTFEALIANEFHGRRFECSPPGIRVCQVIPLSVLFVVQLPVKERSPVTPTFKRNINIPTRTNGEILVS
jgi:ABC-type multidrug transport system permease subunit